MANSPVMIQRWKEKSENNKDVLKQRKDAIEAIKGVTLAEFPEIKADATGSKETVQNVKVVTYYKDHKNDIDRKWNLCKAPILEEGTEEEFNAIVPNSGKEYKNLKDFMDIQTKLSTKESDAKTDEMGRLQDMEDDDEYNKAKVEYQTKYGLPDGDITKLDTDRQTNLQLKIRSGNKEVDSRRKEFHKKKKEEQDRQNETGGERAKRETKNFSLGVLKNIGVGFLNLIAGSSKKFSETSSYGGGWRANLKDTPAAAAKQEAPAVAAKQEAPAAAKQDSTIQELLIKLALENEELKRKLETARR